MKWFKEKPPSIGEVRFITSYCLLPTTIGEETRWLEKSYILQVYSETEEVYSDDELDYLLGLDKSIKAHLTYVLNSFSKILQPKFPKFNIQQEGKIYPAWINQKFVDKNYLLRVKIKKSLI